MGDYTPTLHLYKPTVGDTGWGKLINRNFELIDEYISEKSAEYERRIAELEEIIRNLNQN